MWLVLKWEKQSTESKQEMNMNMKTDWFGTQTSLSITTPITTTTTSATSSMISILINQFRGFRSVGILTYITFVPQICSGYS